MATLTGSTIAGTYLTLLKLTSAALGADASAKYIEDAAGTDSALSLSTTRVGIGTASPDGKFHIMESDASLAPQNVNSTLILEENSHTYIEIMTPNDKTGGIIFSDGVQDGWLTYDHSTRKMQFHTGATAAQMTIDSAGNVGILTPSPTFTHSGHGIHILQTGGAGHGASIKLDATGANDGQPWEIISSGGTGINSGFLGILEDGSDYRMVISDDGNVGIGTNAPGKALDIKAAKSVSDSVVYSQINILDTTAHSSYPTAGIRFQGYDTGSTAFTMGSIMCLKKDTVEHDEDTLMRFLTNKDGTGPTTRMTINEYGFVGIGAPTPLYPLEVIGDGSSNFVAMFDNSEATSTSHGIRIKCGDTDHSDSDTHYIEFYQSNAVKVGELDSDSGNLALSDTSDYRLKENVNLITGGLAKINALKPSTFNYKKYPNKVHEGFIAHEVQEAGIGYAVKGEKDAMKTKVTPAVEAVDAVLDGDGNIVEAAIEAVAEKTEQVDDNQLLAITNLIPQMVSAIQELSAKVTALENA